MAILCILKLMILSITLQQHDKFTQVHRRFNAGIKSKMSKILSNYAFVIFGSNSIFAVHFYSDLCPLFWKHIVLLFCHCFVGIVLLSAL